MDSPAAAGAPAAGPAAPSLPEAGARCECPICRDGLNRSTRRPASCPYCRSVACAACLRRYFVSVDEPACMFHGCRLAWPAGAVDAALPKVFVLGELRAHREDVLLERERALLPETQAVVRREAALSAAAERVRKLAVDLAAAKNRMYRLRYHGHDEGDEEVGGAQREVERRAFVKPCPADGCRGFLTTAYRCGLCNARVCPDCHELKAADSADVGASGAPGAPGASGAHVCDPAAVESVLAIKRDCKPCPKCGAMIHRIHGCNQMFCTAPGCATAFDWATLRILDPNRAHNPHLFEFLAQQGREQGQGRAEEAGDACRAIARLPSPRELWEALHPSMAPTLRLGPGGSEVYNNMSRMMRFIAHVEDVELRHRYLAAPDVVHPDTNRDLRKQFLRGDIDEKRLKELLQMREKARLKRDAIHNVLRTVVDVGRDLFGGFIADRPEGGEGGSAEERANAVTDQMTALAQYVNGALTGVARRYNCVVPYVDPTRWALTSQPPQPPQPPLVL